MAITYHILEKKEAKKEVEKQRWSRPKKQKH